MQACKLMNKSDSGMCVSVTNGIRQNSPKREIMFVLQPCMKFCCHKFSTFFLLTSVLANLSTCFLSDFMSHVCNFGFPLVIERIYPPSLPLALSANLVGLVMTRPGRLQSLMRWCARLACSNSCLPCGSCNVCRTQKV